MSYILGIDTSSTELSTALMKDGAPVASINRYIRNSHAEQITEAVKYLFASTGIGVKDIIAVGVANGPGSFTGLRIGISFLKGLFFGSEVPVLPVSSLESLAYAWASTRADGTVMAAMDARQGRAFCATFEKKGQTWVRLSDDTVVEPADFTPLGTTGTTIIDRMGYPIGGSFDTLCQDFLTDASTMLLQRGFACATLAMNNLEKSELFKKIIDIDPEYGQDSYATRSIKG